MRQVVATQTVLGYDVSEWQSDLNIHKTMKERGAKFCFIKCSEGTSIKDQMFTKHWAAAKAQGMLVAPYCYVHTNQDPIAQVNNVVNQLKLVDFHDLNFGVICDYETNRGLAPGYKNHADQALAFLNHCENITDKPSILYGAPFFLRDTVQVDSRFEKFPLWIANYGVSAPYIPDGYKTWAFWQYTDSQGKLDLNWFNGGLDALNKMAGLTEAENNKQNSEEKKMTGSQFTKNRLAQVAEFEANKNLVWKPGSEATKFTDIFKSVFGSGRFAWCGAFVTWCCREAGLNIPMNAPSSFGFTFALVEAWQQWFQEKGFYFDNDGKFVPEAGDIVMFDWDQTSIDQADNDWEDHIGVFLRMEGNLYVVAEGNTNNMSAVKKRPAITIQGFGRIPDNYEF